MKKVMKKKKHGFTLIELIVVIAILGILATIAIPRVGAFRANAETAAIVATSRTIASSVSMYQAVVGLDEEPTVDLLTDYLSDATGLSTHYVITYANHAVASIAYKETASSTARVWTVGSDTLTP